MTAQTLQYLVGGVLCLASAAYILIRGEKVKTDLPWLLLIVGVVVVWSNAAADLLA